MLKRKPGKVEKKSNFDSGTWDLIGAAPEKRADYDDPFGGDGTRLMPALRSIHKMGAVESPEQLRKGEKVEQEHEGTIIALQRQPDLPVGRVEKMIAQDHLREIPDYYTRLAKMEAGAEKRAGWAGDLMARAAGHAIKNPGQALRIGGGLAGAAAGAGIGAFSAEPGDRMRGAIKGGLAGGALGLGGAHMLAKQPAATKMVENWGIRGAARYGKLAPAGFKVTPRTSVPLAATPTTGTSTAVVPPPPVEVGGKTAVASVIKRAQLSPERLLEAEREKTAAVLKRAWSWEGFKEGIQDEGIPLSGATLGAGVGHLLHKTKSKVPLTGLTGAALGYALGSGASMAKAKLQGKDKEPSTAQRVLAMSGLGYGLGGLTHGGLSALAKRGLQAGRQPGMFHRIFNPEAVEESGRLLKPLSKGTHFASGLTEELLPAAGATGMTGVALATDKSHNRRKGAVQTGPAAAISPL